MARDTRNSLAHNLVLPTILFAGLGGMTWAVRGCSGFGGGDGCLFAGVLWGTAWWFIARDPAGSQSRRYTSGWIILAVALGFAYAGNRGWAQWKPFFEGRLNTNVDAGEFVAISPAYGFLWLFIAGAPWAGLGACALAWCGSKHHTRWWQWLLRIGCGVAGYWIALTLFRTVPQLFLPLYNSIEDQYLHTASHPTLQRLINDNRAATCHMGLYLGFLAFEIGRRDWKNAVLILTVGIVNGLGWSLLQNWYWAEDLFEGGGFNWWRCWESSGGISIGIAYGLAYYLVNRPMNEQERAESGAQLTNQRPNLERFAVYTGLLYGLGLSLRNGLKGWANLYIGNEDYWSGVLWMIFGPLILLVLLGIVALVTVRRLPNGFAGDVFPHAYKLVWLALIMENAIAWLVTGPLYNTSEFLFALYYLILFALTGTIIFHFNTVKKLAFADKG